MFCIATNNLNFRFNVLTFRQIGGVATWEVLLAQLLLIFLLVTIKTVFSLDSKNKIKPVAYYRYVDVVFAICPSKNNVDSFFTSLTRMHSIYRRKVNFRRTHLLDINIIRNSNNSISTSVYRKGNFTTNYISCNCFCPTKEKLKIIQCITNREFKH